MKSLIQYLGITGFIFPATASQIPSIFQKFFAFYPDRTTAGKNNEISGNKSILTQEMQPLK
jgi:hypothetical protein